jgi:D-sedoheptulose 7-phosphate isomerase
MGMKNDPRHRNQKFDGSSICAYLTTYADTLRSALHGVNADALDRARALIEEAAVKKRRIFAIGNGGSAAIADHLSCDLIKGTHTSEHPIIDTLSMSSNVALYSAIANDYGFEQVFATQVSFLGQAGDVLVAISSSGNSANILLAVEAAHAAGMSTIGLSGFSGGKLKEAVQVSVHVAANNYGVVEDAHQAIMHIIAQFIAGKRDGLFDRS